VGKRTSRVRIEVIRNLNPVRSKVCGLIQALGV
jgi:hypothetical protein